ncbi:hypothetical protein H6G74_25440 [Nostoc spongiaeforme FACHB-130]|uniref:Uncharacterized protein n=1 Tax=Nostoc spongiaeforme FACHB-130 TaxID=1357510 RepID=A0ABR8G3C4_9NOSO|nr:hypothetical protein [Nostoc spongiaeforme]MBD2597640.1 hypothetical protein [Nostoc spongiaeforme FACHB-130]
MGAEVYWYYTNYQPDLNAALQKLRQREFQAGRYNPAIPLLDFPITENSPAPGAQHISIEAALEASEADGTRSILDILRVDDRPCPLSRDEFKKALRGGEEFYQILGEVFNTAFLLPPAELMTLFGTEQPTHEMIESVLLGNTNPNGRNQFWHSIDRGTARYIIVYADNQPSEIFFAGYSFD